MIRLLIISFIVFITTSFDIEESVWIIQTGQIHFRSEAPLEVIEATSKELKGVIDTKNRTFAFTIDVKSFNGFNNLLQQTHFYENYMESVEHQQASFTGKIIEKTVLSKDGVYTLRAKGKLKIHGVEQERIIKSQVAIKDGTLQLRAFFTIFLVEHDISIPKIVHQKIAEEIQVRVEAALEKK
ncbi:MAG: YceI family protein [Saprospiraceae bacterium]|jgi:hypothetical protein|nr:YceI family protein [Saprospiraceae bacterium]